MQENQAQEVQQEEKVKVPTVADVKKMWEGPLSSMYVGFDCMPSSFYYSLVSVLNLHEANHILEVGCGRCLLVPYSLGIKRPEATYLATDLSAKMIEFGHKRLQENLNSY